MPRGSLDRRRKTPGDYVGPVSTVLGLLGFEVATRGISTGFLRLREGIRAVRLGEPVVHVPTGHFLFGLGLLVLVAIGGSLTAWRLTTRGSLSGGPNCPDCGQKAKRIRRKAWHRVAGLVLGSDISRRRCDQCGWVGLVKDS